MYDFINDPRFKGIEPFKNKIWLSSPTMHGDEQRWVDEAIQTNWVSTVGANINEVEKMTAEKVDGSMLWLSLPEQPRRISQSNFAV